MAQIIQKGRVHYKTINGDDYIIIPRTEASLVQMENGESIEEAINGLKKLSSGMKISIMANEWTDSTLSGELKEVIVNHNLNIELESFSISFYKENESMNLDYMVIDSNSFVLYSDLGTEIDIIIRQVFDVRSHEHDSVYSKIGHTHDAASMAEISLSDYYDKSEIDNKIAILDTKEEIEKLREEVGILRATISRMKCGK